MIRRWAMAGVGLVLLAGCAPATVAGTPATRPSSTGSGCVGETAARAIWTSVNQRLDAVVLDPRHAGLETVASGPVLNDLRQYIATRLVANHWTEREVDRLDRLTVVTPGCAGDVLRVTVAVTTTTDDYLRRDGTLDHHDPAVGRQLHLSETFERSAGSWRETSLLDLDAPPTPGGPIV